MSSTTPQRLAYVTSGAAGMYCGSCMQDNTLARGLTRLGIDVQLIPTYTPIRTDEDNVSVDRVFFGGINLFLEQKLHWYRYLSPLIGPLLDRPWLIKWATRQASSTDPATLGAMAVSMLRGEDRHMALEGQKLCNWIGEVVQPHIVQFSNILIGGCIPRLKSQLQVPLVVTLQGDDIFLESLPEPYRGKACAEIRRLVSEVDGFLVHSRYYADFMADYFEIPPSKLHLVPLGIDTADFDDVPAGPTALRPLTIGYLARLTPEKGFDLLVDAFIKLRQREGLGDVRLQVAGWLDSQKHGYLEAQREKLRQAGCADAFHYLGSVDRQQKVSFLRGIDVLSVPTSYRDPKGIFVLEALAAGVPVVQPAHGAFPELVTALGGGTLFAPDDCDALTTALEEILLDPNMRRALGQAGRAVVHERHDSVSTARATWRTLEQFLPDGFPQEVD